MSPKINRASVSPDPEALASLDLQYCYTDFVLSRKAMMVSEKTLVFYDITSGQFIRWLVQRGKLKPEEILAKDMRAYLNEFIEGGGKTSYVHGHARAICSMLKFFHE